MTAVINPQYDELSSWLSRVPELFATSGEVLYHARNEVRHIVTPTGLHVCVKRYRRPVWFNRVVYTFLRSPKAERAYHNAFVLLNNDIPTPEPVAYLLESEGGLLTTSYLITLFCPYTHNFYEFRQHPLSGSEHIVTALAQLAARMHESGVMHKDFSPGNILFEDDVTDVNLAVVDINRMHFSARSVGMREGCRNFARLWGKDDFFTLLAREYALARGYDQEECVALTLKYTHRYWRGRK